MILIQFQTYSLKMTEDNLVECYLNKHIEGQSYRVVVKDKSAVDITYYSNNARLYSFEIGQKTIFEGENNDIPHIFFNRH